MKRYTITDEEGDVITAGSYRGEAVAVHGEWVDYDDHEAAIRYLVVAAGIIADAIGDAEEIVIHLRRPLPALLRAALARVEQGEGA